MTNPVIPRGMRPVTEGYSMSAPGGVARTEVAGGMARYGLAWDRGVQTFRVTMVLDDTQFSVWTAFFLHVVKKGSIAFEMPLDSGYGVAPHLCNIVPDSYSANRTAGGNYSVSMVVEAESAAYQMTSADALALLAPYDLYGRTGTALLVDPVLPRGMRPVTEGYSMSAPGGVARSEVDGGMARYGLSWDRGVQQFRATMILDDTQFSVWVAFFLHVTRKGSIAFKMPLDSGYGLEPHLCNIVPDSYSANRTAGGNYAVSMVVEAESAAYQMSNADALAMVAFYNEYGRDSDALLARLHQFANIDTLVLGT